MKVYNNLKKLAKKQKKIINNATNKNNKIKHKYLDKSDHGKTFLKSSILSKHTDTYYMDSNSKMTKTQRKPKIKRINKQNKIESPINLFNSESDSNDFSQSKPNKCLNIISKLNNEGTVPQTEPRRLYNTNDGEQYQILTPGRLDNIESDGLGEINEGTQHGWLASQHHTENDSPMPSNNRFRMPNVSLKKFYHLGL